MTLPAAERNPREDTRRGCTYCSGSGTKTTENGRGTVEAGWEVPRKRGAYEEVAVIDEPYANP